MGMFDYVKYECVCPICQGDVDGFQSKDNECVLDVVQVKDVDNFYTSCDKCGCWIEFTRIDEFNFKRVVEKDVFLKGD